MRTASLRRRVTLLVVGVFALLLIAVGVLVDVALGAQLGRDLDHRLADRTEQALTLADQGRSPQYIQSHLAGQGILVQIRESDGTVIGDALGTTATPSPPPPGRAHGRPPAPPQSTGTTKRVVERLGDGSVLTMVADTGDIGRVRSRLRIAMAAIGGGALVLAAGCLLVAVGPALRPLDTMTAVAKGIAAGDRGRRLSPGRTDTELGRTAAAFDEMLEALEGTEARASAAADEARQAEATMRRFLSDAAHELRTPLTGIQSLAESLVREPASGVVRHERYATMLVRETRRAARLVGDMLELAQIEGGLPLRYQQLDLRALMESEAERARVLAAGLTVTVRGERTLLLPGDPGRLAQVLTNLLDNARRHTPSDGRIDIALARHHGHAEFTVQDSGGGIPDDSRERVFHRLVRLDEARREDGSGAGLGLPIARALTRAHGGELTCEPSPGGALFRVRLPIPADQLVRTSPT